MGDALYQWAMHMAAAAVVSALLELLLPGGNLKKFARVGLGLLMLWSILRPLAALVKALA